MIEARHPEPFASNIVSGLGEQGAAWLDGLPALLESLAQRWELTLGAPFDLSFNYVCRATVRPDFLATTTRTFGSGDSAIPSGASLRAVSRNLALHREEDPSTALVPRYGRDDGALHQPASNVDDDAALHQAHAREEAVSDREAVLKVGPWGSENVQEIRALRLYGGRGACQLLDSDESLGAALLERVRPGARLRDVVADDDEATRIAVRLMRRLWVPIDEIADTTGLRPLASWFARAFARHRAEYGGAGPFPSPVFEAAEGIARELLASAPREVLLHADLHHENILAAEREPWLAIDPKGMLGDPGYEVGPFLLNPDPQTSPPKGAALLRRRLDILAEMLAYDRERLRLWGVAHTVLSACWSAENGGSGWQNAIAAAEHLLEP